MSDEAAGFDIFLSHSSPDKEWVRALHEALERLGLRAFLDERDIGPGENFVLSLSDAVRDSRFLVLVVTPKLVLSQWVEKEWTTHMETHGPVGRIIPISLEPAELPPFLRTQQQIDATHRDVDRVAADLAAIVGRADDLKEGDTRRLYIGQELTFVLSQSDNHLQVTDPTGHTREVDKPWTVDNRFGVAFFGFKQLTKKALESDADRAELSTHARTLGELMFDVLFGTDECQRLLRQASLPGRPQPLVTIRSEDDVLLSLPWELLWHDDRFLVRDAQIDMARSTLGDVGPGALLQEPENYFKLVVNVSAPQGSGLNYEAESYRITRALSERCELIHTELGTVDDLIETVGESSATGVHFSGHGSPGQLQFESDEGLEAPLAVDAFVGRLRARVPGGALPPFFYLASCHGNEPSAPEEGESGSESSAALLHRAGVPQVVGYYGPIADELSTRAEEALYASIAKGHPTRFAVRQARQALAKAFWGPDQKHRPAVEDGATAPEPAPASPLREAQSPAITTHPFGWAQLVFYHRGPDHPLSLPVPADETRRVEQQLQRTFAGLGNRKRLSTGFIGRRSELHRIRRRLREGDRVLVFQGLGGLGKTTLALHTLPLLAEEKDVCNLWCQEAETEENPAEQLVGQLHSVCNSRIKQPSMCPVCGEIPRDEIVKGYEYAKDQYVVLDLKELDKLRSEDEGRAIRIDAFIRPEAVDPVHYSDSNYYLVPDGPAGQKSYALFHQAMARENLHCVARVVLHNKEQLVLVRPLERLLCMTVLKYTSQVKLPAAFDDELAEADVSDTEYELARTLVEQTTVPAFDLSSYTDEYTDKLTQLIEKKVAGEEIVGAPAVESKQVISLMDALKASVEQAASSGEISPVKVGGTRKRATAKKKTATVARKKAVVKKSQPGELLAEELAKPKRKTSAKRKKKSG